MPSQQLLNTDTYVEIVSTFLAKNYLAFSCTQSCFRSLPIGKANSITSLIFPKSKIVDAASLSRDTLTAAVQFWTSQE